jgi:hypothetical protein
LTLPFVDTYMAKYGEVPTYTAGTYDAIYGLVEAIERAGTLDSDAVVAELEKTDTVTTAGHFVYTTLDNAPLGNPHDVTYGPGYVTGLATQWQDGKLKGIWPKKEFGTAEWAGVEYPGTAMWQAPPRVIEKLKAEAATEASPTPEAPPSGELSFKAAEYTNADLGFSVKYPSKWKENEAEEKAPSVFYAADPARVPLIRVMVIEKVPSFSDAVKAGLESGGSTSIKVGDEQEITLPDGTKATAAKVNLKSSGYDAEAYVVGVKQGDKWIVVSVSTVALLIPYDEAVFSEIAQTLTFK